MQYRPEIDGLRAVAVLPVIFFHAGLPGFPGGFVGVDVFFVISGYLITAIIWSDLERERFTFARFYERRARRILPALLFVIAACLPFAVLWLPPDRIEEFAFSAVAALFSFSNIVFWSQAGYFAPAAEGQPLLHTWSLGVEEQFYILFPVLLIAFHRRRDRKGTMVLLAVFAVLSLVLCQWASRYAPDAAFFLIPFRAWELILGSLCALHLHDRKVTGDPVMASVGLAMIALSIVLYSDATPFPSLAALLPVGGTALVILYAHRSNLAVRILSLRPLVWLGLISYSAYLWHQPLLAFARARTIGHIPMEMMLALSALSILLAWLSWRWVEQPFRKPAMSFGKWAPRPLPILGGAFVSLVAIAVALPFGSNFTVGGDAQRMAGLRESARQTDYVDRCKLNYLEQVPQSCDLGDRHNPVLRIALIGDSHASQWSAPLHEAALERGWAVDTFAKSACPLAEVEFTYAALKRPYDECSLWRTALMEKLAGEAYDLVIATHSAMSYRRYNSSFNIGDAEWGEGMKRLSASLDRLPGQWAILSDNAQFRQVEPVDCIVKSALMAFGDPYDCLVRRDAGLDLDGRVLERELATASRRGSWIDLADAMCDATMCDPRKGELILLADNNHLSVAGTKLLLPKLAAAIETIERDGAQTNRLAAAEPH